MMSDFHTISALMLRDTEFGFLLDGMDRIHSLSDANTLCDALEEVIRVWKNGLDAFGMTTHEECAAEAYGSVMVLRLLFADLGQALPEVPRSESGQVLRGIRDAFAPMATSYAKTPMLAQFYVNIPLACAEIYNRLRGKR